MILKKNNFKSFELSGGHKIGFGKVLKAGWYYNSEFERSASRELIKGLRGKSFFCSGIKGKVKNEATEATILNWHRDFVSRIECSDKNYLVNRFLCWDTARKKKPWIYDDIKFDKIIWPSKHELFQYLWILEVTQHFLIKDAKRGGAGADKLWLFYYVNADEYTRIKALVSTKEYSAFKVLHKREKSICKFRSVQLENAWILSKNIQNTFVLNTLL